MFVDSHGACASRMWRVSSLQDLVSSHQYKHHKRHSDSRRWGDGSACVVQRVPEPRGIPVSVNLVQYVRQSCRVCRVPTCRSRPLQTSSRGRVHRRRHPRQSLHASRHKESRNQLQSLLVAAVATFHLILSWACLRCRPPCPKVSALHQHISDHVLDWPVLTSCARCTLGSLSGMPACIATGLMGFKTLTATFISGSLSLRAGSGSISIPLSVLVRQSP